MLMKGDLIDKNFMTTKHYPYIKTHYSISKKAIEFNKNSR